MAELRSKRGPPTDPARSQTERKASKGDDGTSVLRLAAVVIVVVLVLGAFVVYPFWSETPPPHPETLAKFVRIETLKAGDGVTFPKPGDTVIVHYTGKLPDGKEFDSSVKRGDPLEFRIGRGRVIRGWDDGIQKLSKGEQARLTIQPEYGYGSRGTPGGPIPPNAVLVFDVELLDIQ